MSKAEIAPAAGKVTNHAARILRNIPQLTLSLERARPTNTTEPTLQCVVDIGRPILLAINTVRAEPISIQTPLITK